MNWKTVGGVATVAVMVVLFAPGWLAGLAPLLVVAICPLSMWFMMRHTTHSSADPASDRNRIEIERLRSEVAELRQQHSDDTVS